MGTNFDIAIYNQEKEALKITYCDECRGEFIITPDRIKSERFTPKGEPIVLYYFTCPHCGRLYKILIDNKNTIEIKMQIEVLAHKLAVLKTKGKNPTQSQLDRVAKYQKLLTKEYGRLDALYKGSFYLKSSDDTNVQE